jgi:hypothetical protein
LPQAAPIAASSRDCIRCSTAQTLQGTACALLLIPAAEPHNSSQLPHLAIAVKSHTVHHHQVLVSAAAGVTLGSLLCSLAVPAQ